ncbi:sigma-70 family RNA polymerase sigma factor [Streptomyces sp. NPDC005573]|uniref:sigma-70 family RNA polymerase sigma factor n=1 Tax=Streptomyces sp. NPDC005573 TaxID=3156890 RepID=UPI0033A90457
MKAPTAEAQASPTTAPRSAEERMRMLYQVHEALLMRSLLGWTHGDRQAAEDLLQETMLRAWRNLDVLYDDHRSVRPWLLTVSRRLAIDFLRARAARPTEVEDDPLEHIPESVQPYEQILDREVLRGALARLSDTHRAVLAQVYVFQRPVRQAAQLLEVPEGTVKSRTHNALRALREALGDRMGEVPRPSAAKCRGGRTHRAGPHPGTRARAECR